MNSYQHYMDTIRLTPEEHAALLSALEARAAPRRPSLLPRLAACACGLALLAGLWTLDASRAPAGDTASSPQSPEGTASAAPVLTLDPKAVPDPELHQEPDTLEDLAGAVPLPWSTPVPTEPVAMIETLPEDWQVFVDTGTAPSAAADLTLDACRALPLLGEHVPDTVPEGFTFASGVVGPDQVLTLLWSDGAMGEVFLSLSRPDTAPETMETSDPAAYDVRLYAPPWSESLPETVRLGGFEDPVFRWEDLTDEIVAARGVQGDRGDTPGLRFTFRILYPDGVVMACRLKGLTVQEAAALVLE